MSGWSVNRASKSMYALCYYLMMIFKYPLNKLCVCVLHRVYKCSSLVLHTILASISSRLVSNVVEHKEKSEKRKYDKEEIKKIKRGMICVKFVSFFVYHLFVFGIGWVTDTVYICTKWNIKSVSNWKLIRINIKI